MKRLLAITCLLTATACIPKDFTIHIPAFERTATTTTTVNTDGVSDTQETSVTSTPEEGWFTAQEWTTILTGVATILGVVIHRVWFHRHNGKQVATR